MEILRELDAPEGTGLLPAHRLLRLAAACSSTAAVSSRDELYPRGMEARRALLLSHGALLGERNWSAQALQDRVASRYPDAEPLPWRPDLDALLQDLGWDLVWSAVEGHYQRRDGGLSTSGTALDRRSTGRVPTLHSSGPSSRSGWSPCRSRAAGDVKGPCAD